jgi:hypothetical protein
MRYPHRWVLIVLIIAALQLAACGAPPAPAVESNPATIEPIAGTELNRVILTEDGAKRIGIETAPVRVMQISGTARMVIPYAAVLYDAKGATWAYTNPEPLTFVRHSIEITSIADNLAVLANDLPSGTLVVTVGAAELFGAEFEFGE